MQISMIDLSQTGGKTTGTSKGGQNSGFGDVLKGLEEKGSTDIMQLLAACGFICPQPQQQQTAQDGQEDNSQSQSETGQGGLSSDLSVSGLSMQNLFALGNVSQGAMSQGVVSQGVVPQGIVSQGGLSQSVASQVVVPQVAVSQGGLSQSVAPQVLVNQGVMSQGILTQSNLSQSVSTSNTADQLLVTPSVAAQSTTNQGIVSGRSAGNFSFTLDVLASASSPTQVLAANIIGTQGNAAQSIATQGTEAQSETMQGFAVQGTGIAQNEQSGSAANNSQQTVTTPEYQNPMTTHMIYGAQTVTNSYGSLSLNQSTPATNLPMQTATLQGSTAAANTPQVQQNIVLAGQTTAFQVSNPTQSGNPKKVDGETGQISGVQAVQVSIGAGAKEASGTAQSGGKDTDSGSKHSDDGSASQSIFGVAQAGVIDTKYTQVASQAQKTDVANQLTGAVKQASDNGNSQISLHLSPEDLGGINIKIVSQGGVLSLQITADNAHTGQLIASGMHELTQSMHDAGLTMDKANVLFDSNGSLGTSSGSQQQSSGQDTSYKMPKWVTVTQNSADMSKTAENQTSGNGTMSILA